jgi:RecA/RadA recombinase
MARLLAPTKTKRTVTKRSHEIDSLIRDINKELGNGRTVIARGRDITWTTAKRWSTGSLGLDIALNGGVPRGMVVQFIGEESCLAADTPLLFAVCKPNGKGYRNRSGLLGVQDSKGGTVERLYQRFHRISVPGKGKQPRPQTKGSEYYISSVNDENRFFWNRIVDVVETGEQICYEVVTQGGHRVVATADHRFFTGTAYVRLKNLRRGDVVMMHTSTPFTRKHKPTGERSYLYVKHHPVAGTKIIGGRYSYKRLARSRAVVEAKMNGLTLNAYVHCLNTGRLTGLNFLSRQQQVHHRDEDTMNDAEDNLRVLRERLHGRHHATKRHNDLRFIATPDRIVSIRFAGVQQTYDVKMAAPHHNFVASRFVVHNSGKTTMAFKVAASIQQTLGADAAIAFISVEGFDKKWANECGCVVPFTKDELRVMTADERERFGDTDELGTFVVASAVTGEDALEVALRFIRSTKFHLVIIDSMAALVPESEHSREMGENTMGKSPAMIGKFLRKAGSAFAARGENDEPNETAVILVNQVRDVIGGYGHPAPQPPGGRALRHWPVASVRFIKGELWN